MPEGGVPHELLCLVAKLQEELGRLRSIWEPKKVIDQWIYALPLWNTHTNLEQPLLMWVQYLIHIGIKAAARGGHQGVEASYYMEL